MNNRLGTIVDLKKYPIQDLNSPLIKELIKKCKNDLDQFSCSTIPNFILPKSLKINKPEHSKQVYGKALPIHFERENIQGDGLID